MGIGVYVERNNYVVLQACGDITVGLDRSSKPISPGGMLSLGDVVRIERAGSTLFLLDKDSDGHISIGYHGPVGGGTCMSDRPLVEIADKEERVGGLLLFVYTGPKELIRILKHFGVTLNIS